MSPARRRRITMQAETDWKKEAEEWQAVAAHWEQAGFEDNARAEAAEAGGALPDGWYLIRRSNWVSFGDFCSLECAQALMAEPRERCLLES
jgi:hypothetical protein